ncbi:MAG: hypothetical protein R3250_18080, partial [Melioribacteraceae bacterium]|nr:hypothetical protein [Melioribacteraceae bacterium]
PFELQIAKNHELSPPSSLNRAGFVRLPASFSFDGIIDELKITRIIKSSAELTKTYNDLKTANKPQLKWRKLPAINTSRNEFGAFYTKLKYDEDWDALWRDDKYPDIVVNFKDKDYSMVFWKGTNYNMNLVTENGKWVGDQSAETFGRLGCMEHMSDKQNRYSHVRIIENNAARIVIHWRYALTDITYRIANTDEVTNWGDWADEYYYIYPDGIAIRHFLVHGFGESDMEYEERYDEQGNEYYQYSITEPTLFNNAGEKPEDNINLQAVTLANLKGEVSHHSYEKWPSGDDGRFANAVDNELITYLNTKSAAKPFYIYEPGSHTIPYGGGIREVDYRLSKFHWRNHWPVSQIPSDGRFILAADRISSSAITSADPVQVRRKSDGAWEGRFILGLSYEPIEKIVPFANYWINTPDLKITDNSYTYEGFSRNERAYLLSILDELESPLKMKISASKNSPLVNPVFIIKNWNSSILKVILNDEELVQGKEYDYSIRKSIDSNDLILWMNIE